MLHWAHMLFSLTYWDCGQAVHWLSEEPEHSLQVLWQSPHVFEAMIKYFPVQSYVQKVPSSKK
jgi:hypothetical protein